MRRDSRPNAQGLARYAAPAADPATPLAVRRVDAPVIRRARAACAPFAGIAHPRPIGMARLVPYRD